MCKSDDEKIMTLTGKAVLTLLNNKADISAVSLSAELRRMTETETDDARRRLAGLALEFTERLFSNTSYPEEGVAEENQSGTAQPLPFSRH